MSHLDILVPFGLPPAELARDIGRALHLPGLSAMLAKTQPRNPLPDVSTEADNGFFRSLPHERWLASAVGLLGNHVESSPPIAPAAMRRAGIAVDDGWWFLLQPVHLHIALDHLVLTDLRQLSVSELESRALFDLIAPLFEESGLAFFYGNESEWFVRADDWHELRTATPDSACGHNIDIWMPKGAAALAWRKLQNEIQMTWFGHPIQEERERRGLKPVNSLWLWGGGSGKHGNVINPYDSVANVPSPLDALASHSQELDSAAFMSHFPKHGLVVLDNLTEAALAGDWGSWIEHANKLETDWFAPLLHALKKGDADSLTILIGDGIRLKSWTCSRATLRKFWLKPSLAGLLA